MPCFIEASNLKVASVLSQAHRKLSHANNVLLKHDIVNRLKFIQVHLWSLAAESQNTISLLTIKVLCLRVNAAKGVFKQVNSIVMVLAKV